jgi:hypothetical protein
MEWVALVLFLLMVVSWLVLPNAKKVSESSVEFSSIGDETKTQMVGKS